MLHARAWLPPVSMLTSCQRVESWKASARGTDSSRTFPKAGLPIPTGRQHQPVIPIGSMINGPSGLNDDT